LYPRSAAFGRDGAYGPHPAHVAARRLRVCGSAPIDSGAPVTVRCGGADGQAGAGYANVQSCGSVSGCPVCAARVRQHRAGEVDRAVLAAMGVVAMADGSRQQLGVAFLTLTVAHDQGDTLEEVFSLVASCWRKLLQSRAGRVWSARWGVVATVRAIEVTHGLNGWHPHLHILLFLGGGGLVDGADRACEVEILALWRGQVAGHPKADGTAWRLPSAQHGVVLEGVRTVADALAVSRYVCEVDDVDGQTRSVGLEVCRHDLKTGRRAQSRTPFEVAAEACDGDVASAHLWAEWVRATKGRQFITFSAGFRERFELEVEKTDDQVVAEAPGGEELVTIDLATWRVIVRCWGGRGVILEAAEALGSAGLRQTVEEIAASRWRPPPGLVAA